MVQLMCEAGFDPRSDEMNQHYSCVLFAVQHNHADVVRYLLERGICGANDRCDGAVMREGGAGVCHAAYVFEWSEPADEDACF